MAPRTLAPRGLIVAAFLAVSLIWGSTYLAIRSALLDFPPFLIGAVRFLTAGGLLYVGARLRGEAAPSQAQWARSALLGVLFFVIGNGLVCVAEQRLSSGLAAVLVATMPLWATVFSRFFGDPVSRREWIGVVLGLVGVFVMNLGGELRAAGAATALALLAPMGWALGSVASRRMTLPTGMMGAGAQMLAGGVSVLVVSLALGERLPSSVHAAPLGALVYLSVMGSLVGFTAYAFLLRHTRAIVATSYAYVNPVVAVALGLILAGERVDGASAVGAVVVLGAVLLVSRGKSAGSSATAREPPRPTRLGQLGAAR